MTKVLCFLGRRLIVGVFAVLVVGCGETQGTFADGVPSDSWQEDLTERGNAVTETDEHTTNPYGGDWILCNSDELTVNAITGLTDIPFEEYNVRAFNVLLDANPEYRKVYGPTSISDCASARNYSRIIGEYHRTHPDFVQNYGKLEDEYNQWLLEFGAGEPESGTDSEP